MQASLIDILRTLPLTAFKLAMDCKMLRKTFGYSIMHQNRAYTPEFHAIEQFLVDLDAEALADRLQENVPSLESLMVELLVDMGGRGKITVQRGPLAQFP